MTTRAPDRSASAVAAALSLIDETRLLFHRMKRAAEQLHGGEGISAGMRGVLFSLDRGGPQTVPQIARARPVSRQHIQMLVNPLIERGYVEPVENPGHKRSSLIRLTRTGQSLVDRMRRREARVLGSLQTGIPDRELRNAAAVVRSFREALAGDRWDRLVNRGR